jgi:hypothetical protein
MATHWDKCRADVLGHADHLISRIRAGKLNAGAFENLMRGYLEQPAFYAEWRRELFALAFERFSGRRPNSEQR